MEFSVWERISIYNHVYIYTRQSRIYRSIAKKSIDRTMIKNGVGIVVSDIVRVGPGCRRKVVSFSDFLLYYNGRGIFKFDEKKPSEIGIGTISFDREKRR